ncbi:MAG: winged helix-turn-helix domain-containing protein [Hyphomonadaceae bacterium]
MTDKFSATQIVLAQEGDFRLGGLMIRPSMRQVERAGGSETIQPRVMQVLVMLARRRGQVVSRDELIAACWEGRAVGEDAIQRCIQRIRKLDETQQDFELETIPRVGYRITASADAPEVAGGRRRGVPTFAVLPFSSRSEAPEDQVFASGMVEDVIAALSQSPHQRVLDSMVTAGLRQAGGLDLAAAGKQLGADYLMDGNVRRTGADLRVSARLLEAATGALIWSGRFERPLKELARLQEELVMDMAGVLNMQIHAAELQRALEKPADITAWEAVNRAMAALRQIEPMSLARALEEAKRAVAIAPDYPLAQGMLAVTSGFTYLFSTPDDPGEVQRVRTIASRAVMLGQDIPFVLVNAASALSSIGLLREATQPLRVALAKAPELGPAHFVAGSVACRLNDPDTALTHLEAAARLLPSPYMLTYIAEWRANALIRAGRLAEAEAALDDSLALSPDYFVTLIAKAVLCRLSQRHEAAQGLVSRAKGMLPLDLVLMIFSRLYVNSAALNEFLDSIRALWAVAAQGRRGA